MTYILVNASYSPCSPHYSWVRPQKLFYSFVPKSSLEIARSDVLPLYFKCICLTFYCWPKIFIFCCIKNLQQMEEQFKTLIVLSHYLEVFLMLWIWKRGRVCGVLINYCFMLTDSKVSSVLGRSSQESPPSRSSSG